MRILRVIGSMNPAHGGPVEGLINSAAVLKRHGHETEIATLDAPQSPWLQSLPFVSHAFGPGRGRYRYTPGLTPWLVQRRADYDAVIIHGLWNYSSVGAWQALRSSHTPYFVFTHGGLDPWFRHAYPIKHYLKQAFWLAVEGRILRDARAVFFTSEEERLLARDCFWGASYRECVVSYGTADAPQGVEPQIEAFRSRIPLLRARRYLLFLSRIHPKKGCDILIRAFASVANVYPNVDLVMCGPDQIGWKDELEQSALKLGVHNRIHWPGMLSGDAKWGAFRGADAFVLPSHSENFGIVVAEAMAAGIPVLVSDKVNIWREIKEMDCGIVAPDTEEGTRSMLTEFLALGASARKKMGAAARAGFLKKFHIEQAALSLLDAVRYFSNDPDVNDPMVYEETGT